MHSAWNAIADLFAGAADMMEAVAKVAYHVVTGNPGAVKDMLMGWVDKLAVAWASRDKIADDFMRKWESSDGWDRGNFQGEVLGWVMMTALIALLTAGEGAAVLMTGRWASVLRVLETLDALGDVTTYARKIGKLPARAVEHIAATAGHDAADAASAGEHAARTTPGERPAAGGATAENEALFARALDERAHTSGLTLAPSWGTVEAPSCRRRAAGPRAFVPGGPPSPPRPAEPLNT
jgi:hypothetical protein